MSIDIRPPEEKANIDRRPPLLRATAAQAAEGEHSGPIRSTDRALLQCGTAEEGEEPRSHRRQEEADWKRSRTARVKRRKRRKPGSTIKLFSINVTAFSSMKNKMKIWPKYDIIAMQETRLNMQQQMVATNDMRRAGYATKWSLPCKLLASGQP